MILEEMLVASPRYGAYVEALEHGLGRGSLAAPDPAISDVRASRRHQEPVRSLDSEDQPGSPHAPRERQTASEGLEDRRSVAGVQGWGARGARRRRFAITHTGLELSMPGHVPSQLEWGFSQREVLFVSPSNPGALEVALQLQRSGLLAAECRVGGRRGLEITSRWRESRRVSQRQLLARHRSSAKNSEATRQWSLITRNASTRNVSVGPEHSAEVPPPPPSHFRGAGRPPAEAPYREHPDALTSLNNLGAGEAGGEDGGGEAEASTSVSSVGAVPVDTDGDGIADTLLTEQSQAAEAAPTRMLLVLNVHSFVGPCGEQLAREVRAAFHLGLPIVSVHVPDLPGSTHGCRFERFFVVTPRDLVNAGLYKPVAVAWYPSAPHVHASCAMLYQAMHASSSEARPSRRRAARPSSVHPESRRSRPSFKLPSMSSMRLSLPSHRASSAPPASRV